MLANCLSQVIVARLLQWLSYIRSIYLKLRSILLIGYLPPLHTAGKFSGDQPALLSSHNDSDTRGLLCRTDGRVIPMTANHHADERGETTRLRRVGGGMVMDSFGDTRWMGSLANTRWYVRHQY